MPSRAHPQTLFELEHLAKVVPTGADGKRVLRAKREARKRAGEASLAALKRKQSEAKEAKQVLNSFYDAVGIGGEPADADWLPLTCVGGFCCGCACADRTADCVVCAVTRQPPRSLCRRWSIASHP